jgi:hypothetical protein
MADRDKRAWRKPGAGGGNAVYGLGLIGALVYYIQHAHGFWAVILAVLKSLVWPAFLIYDVLKHVAG